MPLEFRARSPHRSDGETEGVSDIPVDRIDPSPYQPRQTSEPRSLEGLAASIRAHGVLQPAIVRRKGDRFEIVAGERRWRACQLAGLGHLPAIVRTLADEEAAQITLIENLQRDDLDFFEEADGYRRLLDEFEMTQETLAAQVGKVQSTIANKLRLLRLDEVVRHAVQTARLSERHARLLLGLEDVAAQLEAVAAFAKGMSVREAEAWVERRKRQGTQRRQTVKGIYKDVRLFVNSVQKLVDQLVRDGVRADLVQADEAGYVEVRVRIRTGEGR